MAMYEYECEVCGKTQTKWHKIADKNEESCENEECKAPAEKLHKLLAKPTHYKHGSWSRWQV